MVKTYYCYNRDARRADAAYNTVPTFMIVESPVADKYVDATLSAAHTADIAPGANKNSATRAIPATIATTIAVMFSHQAFSKSTLIPISLCPMITSCMILLMPIS